MGTEFLKIMDHNDVKDIIKNIPIKRKTERIPLKEAHRRVLAEDIRAKIDLPPFNRVSRDGYAVKAEDTFRASEDKPAKLKCIEIILAGEVATKKVEKGTCIEVNTGAPTPEGADGVVMVEFTEKEGDNVYINKGATVGQHIAYKGSDIQKNDPLLNSGILLTHDKIGVLAAIGIGEVLVFKKPKVVIISTGNEIINYDEEMEYGKIYDINSQTIANAVKSCGCIPIYSGISKDDYNDIKNNIKEHLDADVIITSGGTSAGGGDVLKVVLDDIGEIFVHGIAVKPGKPTIVGIVKDKPIFGLPGYPAAALTVFHVFVAPFLRKMAFLDSHKKSDVLKLKISKRYHSSRGRHQFVLVKIEKGTAHPILKDSGAITAIAEADGYFEIPKNVEMIPEESEIEVILLESR
ncbi:MAG: molybdopterin molybdenumtransferase MoeA [Methanobacterium sp.]|uniref:molybdenum cofactor synthesis domain-containing protein n=1 Tax=Methanobacterium sp. TaxID=2164 RepID=UPI003D649AD1|nr:molybdopterin molybdenumtransferase MoeA [Methanobacterium sp.]